MHTRGELRIRLGQFQSGVVRVPGRGGGRAVRGLAIHSIGFDWPQSSGFQRVGKGSGVGEGSRTPGLQNHNLAL